MKKKINEIICKLFGHKFLSYEYLVFKYGEINEIEQAGHCTRCGYDTHESI